MKHFSYFLLLCILVHINTVSLGLSSPSQDGQDKSVTKSASKKYKVHFLSLKRGHKIASSCFTLEDQNKLGIKIPGETFLETKGEYAKNGLQFNASFEGTIIRGKKHYHYTFNISGFSLLDSYIAGTMVLNETIKETNQNQEITFLLLGTLEESNTSDNEKGTLFPF